MKGTERIIIAPKNTFPKELKKLVEHLHSINRTMNYVDDYVGIKNNFDQVILKSKEIKSFQKSKVSFFTDCIIELAECKNGTSFLISKN